MSPSGQVSLSVAAPLPSGRTAACSGSDGTTMVLAGGVGSDEVLVLPGVGSIWGISSATVGENKKGQAGVLVGDTLVCLGGTKSGVSGEWVVVGSWGS